MFDFNKINSFQVETSTYCNVACPLCPRHFMGTSIVRPTLRQRHILWPQWQKFLTDMDPILENMHHNPSLVFCGCHGDPAMTPDWEPIIVESSKRKYVIDVETNGSMWKPDVWSNIGKAMGEAEQKQGVEKVMTFSIDGLADTNKLYRIGINHERVMANAKAFIEAGGKARWKMIVFKHNEHQIDEAKQLAKDMGFWEFDKHVSTRNFEYNFKELEKKNKREKDRLAKEAEPEVRGEIIPVEKLSDTVKEIMPDYEVETDARKARKGVVEEQSETKVELNITQEGAEIYKKVLEQADISTITCDFKEQRMMYIDAEMLLWPCNHIAATKQEDMTHMNKLQEEYGVGWNSLEKHTAEEIFNHEYIQSILPLTWKDPSHRLCTYECQEMCGGGLHSAAWMASTNREEITH